MKILVFGEILWDVFGDEAKLGGAPLNFAAHSSKIGAETEMVSALGKDKLGNDALAALKELGVGSRFVTFPDKPTGYCAVTLKDGHPSYNLVTEVAYDYIEKPDEKYDADAFYFGTLAQRSPASKAALDALLEKNYKEVFFDINIRGNFYNDKMIDDSLKAATILKISDEEIGVLGIEGDNREICRKLSVQYPNLKLILVTLGKYGSICYNVKTKRFSKSPVPASKVVSTVGAGDSFSAAFLTHYMAGDSIAKCLKAATTLSDYVVTQLGAVPEYTEEIRRKIIL